MKIHAHSSHLPWRLPIGLAGDMNETPITETLSSERTINSMKHLKYFYNGHFLTMAPHSPYAGHMMVAGDRILSCSDEISPLGLDYRLPGFDADRRRLASDIEFIDLDGRTVMPGFTDAHAHIMMWADNLLQADLAASTSEDDAVRITKEFGRHKRPGEWITGYGWAHNLWEGAQLPSAASLDATFPDNPVFLASKCGHVGWANSAALSAVGIKADSPNPAGGEIVMEGGGTSRRPTGILLENAMWLIEHSLGTPSEPDRLRALLEAQRLAHSFGITGIHAPENMNAWNFIQRFHQANRLTLRINYLLPAAVLDHFDEAGIRQGFGDHHLRIAGVKLFTDGSLGGRTAYMKEAYEGEPDNFGMCINDRDAITRVTLQANSAGLPMAIHAIGDRSIADVLAAFDTAQQELGDDEGESGAPPTMRNRIEHFQTFDPADLDIIRRVKPVASMQPVHLCADMGPADRHIGDRSRHTYAMRTLADAGCILAFGSDAPVEPINPMFGLFAAVNRQNLEGEPGGGWIPEERISIKEALAAYTRNPAIVSGESDVLGTLESGKLADFIILPEDPEKASPHDLRDMKVLATYVDGTAVYEREA